MTTPQIQAVYLTISGSDIWFLLKIIFIFLKIFYLLIFREKGREGERERNINVWLPLTCPLLGTWPATQECALTGNQTGDPLVHRPTLNPLSILARAIWFFIYFI